MYKNSDLIELTSSLPNPIKMAVGASQANEAQDHIYTSQTKAEFYSLLLELLSHYSEAVKTVSGNPKEAAANSTENST